MDLSSLAAPSNKFSKPQLDPRQLLPRTTLISEKLPQDLSRKKIIILDAQAGQGKTVLAYQIADLYENTSLWYQIDEGDNDPFFFLAAVYQCFVKAFSNFHSPQFEDILNRGPLGPLDARRFCNLLLNNIDRHLTDDIYLVLDDFHKIDPDGLTAPIIVHFFDSSPPKLHFLITTRTPINLWCKALLDQSSVVTLHTKDLALSEQETRTLLLSILGENLDPASIHQLHNSTDGWIMGIILAVNPFHRHYDMPERFSLLPSSITSHSQLLCYFQEEIFTHIPKELTIIFLKLSLLNEIPSKLATAITDDAAIEDHLLKLVQRNCFITLHRDDNEAIYRFHHLFQEFLQIFAKKTLQPETIKEIYSTEAAYYLKQDRPAQAVASHAKAGEYEKINDFLKHEGLNLLSSNRTSSIYPVMQKIPQETLLQYEWLTLITGIIQGDFTPGESLPLLESARQYCIQKNDPVGELVALAQTIYFHFVVSGRYITGAKLLPRAEELYEQHQDSLRTEVKIIVLRNLASGYWFFIADFEKARTYATTGKELAEKHQMKNFMASTRFIIGYIELLAGNFSNFMEHAEVCYDLLNDPLVGTSNKLTIRIMHLCYRAMTGDTTNFIIEKEELIKSIDIEVTRQTVASPYLPLWEALLAMHAGDLESARASLQVSHQKAASSKSDHMTSQSLQWMALLEAAENGNPDKIKEKIELSKSLRKTSGGPFYSCLNLIVSAAVDIVQQNYIQAEKTLIDSLEQTTRHKLHYLHTCAELHLAHLYLDSGKTEHADTLLNTAFASIIQKKYKLFWSILPTSWDSIIKYCEKQHTHDININTIKSLLPINIKSHKTSTPTLNIQLLSGFSCDTEGQPAIDANTFSPQQRQLLAMLINSPNRQVPIDAIQLIFWPDSPPEKARRNFDALIERMRKILSDELSLAPKCYLALSKGVLKLTHCKIDLDIFMKWAGKGFTAAGQNRWWQASSFFNCALQLWDGLLPCRFINGDAAIELEDDFIHIVNKIASTWGPFLQSKGLNDDAAKLYEKAWGANMLDHELACNLYQAYQSNNDRQKCWKMLERYRNALISFDYDLEEIDSICNELITLKRQ